MLKCLTHSREIRMHFLVKPSELICEIYFQFLIKNRHKRRCLQNRQQILQTPVTLAGFTPGNRAAADLRLTLHGHQDRPVIFLLLQMKLLLAAVSVILIICRLNKVNYSNHAHCVTQSIFELSLTSTRLSLVSLDCI